MQQSEQTDHYDHLEPQKSIIVFPDLFLLWAFVQTLHPTSLEINAKDRTLICECTGRHLLDAVNNYKALIISTEKIKK